MKPEQKMWNDVKKKALDKIVGVRFERIEPFVGSGIPDVTFTYNGHHGWIELKVCEYLKKANMDPKQVHLGSPITINWRPDQRKWLYDRDRMGGNCWLLVWHYTGWYAMRGIHALQMDMSNIVKLSVDDMRHAYHAIYSEELTAKFLMRVMDGD